MTKDIPEDLEHDNCCQHLLREQDSSGVSIVLGWREKQKKIKKLHLATKTPLLEHSQALQRQRTKG